MNNLYKKGIFYWCVFLICCTMGLKETKANYPTEVLSAGSYIINMGVSPQTASNALKPYGLVYEMIVTHYVPVKWVIDSTKAKDGADFTYDGTDYKGGTFIIPAEYIDSTVADSITSWVSRGVQGTYTTSSITVPVYSTLTSFPKVLIDTLSSNQAIVIAYYDSAGIPSSAYDIGAPVSLNSCHDLWANPHGDPVWSTHSYLYDFVTVQKSYIWSQCHAVSMLEGCYETTSPFRQLNYLTTKGLKCWKTTGGPGCGSKITENHTKNSSSPYTYNYSYDPVMQFIGTESGAHANGSEQWFQPMSTGQWNTGTKRLITTGTGTSPNEGVLMVYGYGYDNSSNGRVMYQSGHDFSWSGTNTEQIAARRAFLNYNLLAGKEKQLLFSTSSIPTNLAGGQTHLMYVTVTSGSAPYTYQWTSQLGGTFSNPNSASTDYTAPYGVTNTSTVDIIRCIVTDACGRQNFYSQVLTIYSWPLPVSLISFTAKETKDNSVLLKWTTASEITNDYFTIERSTTGKDFSELIRIKGAGNSSSVHNYSTTDDSPLDGVSYYRLKQTDFDGKSEIFTTVAIRRKAPKDDLSIIQIAPNPFKNYFSLIFSSPKRQNLRLQVMNTNGIVVHSEMVEAEEGNNMYRISPSVNLLTGLYLLRIINDYNKVAQTKIVCSDTWSDR